MAIISTRNARVQVNGQNLLAYKWSVEIRADEIDITNFESGGFTDHLTSYVDAMVTVDGFWDKATNEPFASPPSIKTGAQLTDVRLYFHKNMVNGFFDFPILVVLSMSHDVSVRDVIRYNFTGRNKGTFTYPDGISFTGIVE